MLVLKHICMIEIIEYIIISNEFAAPMLLCPIKGYKTFCVLSIQAVAVKIEFQYLNISQLIWLIQLI